MNKQFRIWDGQKFLSSEYFAISTDGSIIQHHICYNNDPDDTWDDSWHEYDVEGLIIQQFTNALDKLQQKIFEGDIVLFDNPDPYDGQDQLTKIVGYNSRVMGFRLYNFTHEVDKYGGQVFFPEEVEVIGNIFEGAVKDGINYGEYLKGNSQ